MTSGEDARLPFAQRLREALSDANLDALGELMDDHVTWGDVNDPRGCRNRRDVLATFARRRDQGVSGAVTELITGPQGILAVLSVRWPAAHSRAAKQTAYQVYVVRNELIVGVRGFDDRESALSALSMIS